MRSRGPAGARWRLHHEAAAAAGRKEGPGAGGEGPAAAAEPPRHRRGLTAGGRGAAGSCRRRGMPGAGGTRPRPPDMAAGGARRVAGPWGRAARLCLCPAPGRSRRGSAAFVPRGTARPGRAPAGQWRLCAFPRGWPGRAGRLLPALPGTARPGPAPAGSGERPRLRSSAARVRSACTSPRGGRVLGHPELGKGCVCVCRF